MKELELTYHLMTMMILYLGLPELIVKVLWLFYVSHDRFISFCFWLLVPLSCSAVALLSARLSKQVIYQLRVASTL